MLLAETRQQGRHVSREKVLQEVSKIKIYLIFNRYNFFFYLKVNPHAVSVPSATLTPFARYI